MNYLLVGEETERLYFRELKEEDFSIWLKFCSDPSSLRYIWLSEDENPEVRCRVWFDRVFNRYKTNKGGMNVLIDKVSGEIIGQCGLLIHTVNDVEELEIGYSIMPEFRNKGYAFEAASKCRDYAFQNNLRESLISIIHVDNIESAKVALKIGMVKDFETYYNNSTVTIFRIRK